VGGESRLLVFEHNRADQLRVELHDDGRAVAVLGGNGEGVGDDGVGGEDRVLGDVSGLLGGLEGWEEDLLVDGVDDSRGGGLGGDGQAEDAEGVGAGGLVEAVELVGEGLDLDVPGG